MVGVVGWWREKLRNTTLIEWCVNDLCDMSYVIITGRYHSHLIGRVVALNLDLTLQNRVESDNRSPSWDQIRDLPSTG